MTIINLHELSGLAEKMERMEVCIDAVDVAEDVDEPALHSWSLMSIFILG